MDVLKEIRKAYPNMQVIFLPGTEQKKDEEEARRLGGFDFLRKPADIETLVGKIKEAYSEKIERMMSRLHLQKKAS